MSRKKHRKRKKRMANNMLPARISTTNKTVIEPDQIRLSPKLMIIDTNSNSKKINLRLSMIEYLKRFKGTVYIGSKLIDKSKLIDDTRITITGSMASVRL